MRHVASILFIAVLALAPMTGTMDATSDSGGPGGHYLGLEPPGETPVIFAPGIVSTADFEWSCTFAPDGDEILFTRMAEGQPEIWILSFDGEKWSDPHPAGFCDGYDCETPFISPGGGRVFYTARQPRTDNEEYRGHGDIWIAEKSDSGWVNHHPADLSTHPYYGGASPASSGTLYSGTVNEQPLVRFRPAGSGYVGPEIIDPVHPENLRGMNPFIAPDESYILFSDKRPGGSGGHDIHISFRGADGTWSQARNLGKHINTSGWESCPMVTPDEEYLFYTSDGDIYWVDAGIIEGLRPDSLK